MDYMADGALVPESSPQDDVRFGYEEIVYTYYGNYSYAFYRSTPMISIWDFRNSALDLKYAPKGFFILTELSTLIEYYFKIPISLIFSAFGIFSNIFVVAVFSHLGLFQDSCTVILVGIGISDYIFSLLNFSAKVVTIINYSAVFPSYFDDLERIRERLDAPAGVFIQLNCLATTYLGFERMASVMFPFHIKRFLSPKRSCCIVIAIFVVCIVLQLHNLLERYTKEVRLFSINLTDSQPIVSTGWFRVADAINYIVLRPISVLLVVLFNAMIIAKVNIAKRHTKSMTSSETATGKRTVPKQNTSKETHLTRMMMAVSVMFLVCYSPRVLFTFLNTVSGVISFNVSIYIVFTVHNVLPVLEQANSCFNLIIYYALSSKFKQGLKSMCPCFKKLRELSVKK